jgi:hypothetical protein
MDPNYKWKVETLGKYKYYFSFENMDENVRTIYCEISYYSGLCN